MIHHDLYHSIISQQKRGPFIYPAYGSYSITEIEPSIRELFGIPTARQTLPKHWFPNPEPRLVVLMVVDGLGFNHLLDHGGGTVGFDRLFKRSGVYPLTSVFPSTTPAALTTLHTGFSPQEHGLLEWYTYFKEFQKVIMPMQFRASWDDEHDALLKKGGTPEMLYDLKSFYHILKESDIGSYAFIFHEYANTAYGRAVQKGSTIVPYTEGVDLMKRLRHQLEHEEGSAFFHVYWGQVDRNAHAHGPNSNEHRSSIQTFADLLEEELFSRINPNAAEDVLLLITADHGHISVAHDTIFYLEDYDFIWNNLQTTDHNEIIVPTGGPNDVFLHIKDGAVPYVLERLQEELAGEAEVMTTQDAVRLGLFGLNKPSARFIDRLGDVVILAYPHSQVWFMQDGKRQYRMKGLHGGLSEAEMMVPFVSARLSDILQK